MAGLMIGPMMADAIASFGQRLRASRRDSPDEATTTICRRRDDGHTERRGEGAHLASRGRLNAEERIGNDF